MQPHQRLTRNQETQLVSWILRQEALGYPPSHGQIRACVIALLQRLGDNKDLGRDWVSGFVERRSELKSEIGRRREADGFDSFTPKAVNWYFGIREKEYGWIKPENTVNVDEGGIMSGFGKFGIKITKMVTNFCWPGLDSLVVGSSDPKKKALLKSPQSRAWTTFVEAVTADGRVLKPGIIFKGKELQKQWFLEGFRKIADWYYCHGTDSHSGSIT